MELANEIMEKDAEQKKKDKKDKKKDKKKKKKSSSSSSESKEESSESVDFYQDLQMQCGIKPKHMGLKDLVRLDDLKPVPWFIYCSLDPTFLRSHVSKCMAISGCHK